MATFQFKGLEQYTQYLQRIEANTEEICGAAVYAMADVVTDEIRNNLEKLETISSKEAIAAWKEKRKVPLTKVQKKALEQSLGISPMQKENGFYNVKAGFDGYNTTKTKKYPNGQPNAMIARSVDSGSSFRQKNPFVRTAVKTAQKKAIGTAKIVVDTKIHALKNNK